MQVDPAKTFATLANCPLLLDNAKDQVVFYRMKEGKFSFLSATKRESLSLWEKIKRLSGSEDFSWATADELVEASLQQLDPFFCPANPEEVENAKGWCRFIKMKATFGSLQNIEQRVNDLFRGLFQDPSRPNSPQKPAPSPPLPSGHVQLEALSLSPRNPSLVHGIENQGNWCYLDAFLQAAFASSSFTKMLLERVTEAEKSLAQLNSETLKLKGQTNPPLQEIKRQEERKASMQGAKIRAEALLTLFKALELPEGAAPACLDKSIVKTFVASFEQTKSFFYKVLNKHSQEDPTELFNALCINDLLSERAPVYVEINTRQKKEGTAKDEKTDVFAKISIKALDKPRDFYDSVIQVAPPDILANKASLDGIFAGILDTYSIEKDKTNIVIQEENQDLFGGMEGELKKKAFLEASHSDILISRKLALVQEAHLSLPIIVNRFDSKGTKKKFEMEIPFRLKVPFADNKRTAIYLLRSAVVHLGHSSRSGHYYTITPDLTTIGAESGQPTHFVCQDDQAIYNLSPEKAIDLIQSNGYFLFYDRVDIPVTQQESTDKEPPP